MNISKKNNYTKGFTLIELLVVVLIIGILAAIALPQYKKAVEKSRATEAVQILNYMHRQGALCLLANENCYGKMNDEIGIELGNGFTCYQDSDAEVCCNDHWCYNNSADRYGTNCFGTSPLNPQALRVHGTPATLDDVLGDYTLEYETEGCGIHPEKIVC